MGLTRVRLGELLEHSDVRNSAGAYNLDSVRGMSIEKRFIPTKANMDGVSLTPYKLVKPDWFSYVTVTSRNGERITLAHNDSSDTYIVSSSYEVFYVSSGSIDSRYLFMLFNRPEFDRYSRFNSWGSARETFSWEDLCDTVIDLPPIDVQRKYVAIYESMLANQYSYEMGLSDLKFTCDALLDKCKRSQRISTLGQLTNVIDKRNVDDFCNRASGIRVGQGFIPAVASSEDVSKYKLVEPGQIACNLLHVGRDAAFPIAINHTSSVLAVSPAYTVLMPKDMAIGDYLVSWFSRHETGRYGWFVSDDNIRSGMSIDRFLGLPIPMPEQSLLDALIGVADALRIRATINERLKAQLKDICPVLIRGSIEESEG